GKYRADSALRSVVDFDRRVFALFDSLAALYRQTQRHPKQLLENQPPMRGTSQILIIVECRIVFGKMRVTQRFGADNELAARAQVRRQSLFDRQVGNTSQDLVNDLAQTFSAKVAQFS